MTQPLVSIITITYNHEKYIGKCINSVLNQTFHNWEHIIVDDGSFDQTPKEIAQFRDKRIRYVRQNNVGVFNLDKTYNKALHLSRGRFIAILEGDDLWPSDKLEKQLPTLNSSKVILSWGKIGLIDDKEEILKILPKFDLHKAKLEMIYRNNPPGHILEEILFHNPIASVSVIIRKDSLLSIGGFQQPSSLPTVDYPTWLKLALKGQFNTVNSVVGFWRRQNLQTTICRNVEITLGCVKFATRFYKNLPPKIKYSFNINSKKLDMHNLNRVASAFFRRGRIMLCKNQWKQARKDFKQAFARGNYLVKGKFIFGILASYLHVDLEILAHLFKKENFRKYNL